MFSDALKERFIREIFKADNVGGRIKNWQKICMYDKVYRTILIILNSIRSLNYISTYNSGNLRAKFINYNKHFEKR